MKAFTVTVGWAAVALILASCVSVPLTGRRQLSLIPASTMLSMSYQEYGEFKSGHTLNSDAKQLADVQRVGGRLRAAIERYFAANGLSKQLDGYDWEFNVVKDEAQNAWVMPGGKVMVYSGIFPVATTEAGLAVVIGHEMAHAVANHGNERMSQGLLAQFGGAALGAAMQNSPAQTQKLWQTVYGVSAQYGLVLPYSRTHELEADRLGLIFMAMAGYDPNAAVGFWERMAADSKGAPPEFLSTHPASATRIRAIKAAIPEAMAHHQPR